jgi:hypothetical protein
MNSAASRFLFTLLAGLATLLLGGCAQTKMTKSSAAPDAPPVRFTKLFILALVPDDFNRRLVEVAVKEQITHIPVVGGYEFLPDTADLKSKEKVFKAIADSGADGLVVFRLVSMGGKVVSTVSSEHPMDYQVYSDYWGTTYDVGAYFDNISSSLDLQRVFNIESRIYDVKTKKLVWSGETQSTKDSSKDHNIPALMVEVSKAIRSELRALDLVK